MHDSIEHLPVMVQRKGRTVLNFEWLSRDNLHSDVHPSENVQSIDWSMDCLRSAIIKEKILINNYNKKFSLFRFLFEL